MDKIRERANNFNPDEMRVLEEIAIKYKNIIENKKTVPLQPNKKRKPGKILQQILIRKQLILDLLKL